MNKRKENIPNFEQEVKCIVAREYLTEGTDLSIILTKEGLKYYNEGRGK